MQESTHRPRTIVALIISTDDPAQFGIPGDPRDPFTWTDGYKVLIDGIIREWLPFVASDTNFDGDGKPVEFAEEPETPQRSIS